MAAVARGAFALSQLDLEVHDLSYLDYMELPWKMIWKPQLVQNVVA